MSADPAGLYALLGVPPTATEREIRSAYLAMARRFHPDRMAEATARERARAGDRMAEVNHAWHVLGDPSRRAAYDGAVGYDGTTRFDAGRSSSATTIRDADARFVPFDDGPDVDIDLDDSPSRARPVKRAYTFAPAGLAGAGIGAMFFGMLLDFGGLRNLGVLLLAAAGLSFVALPLIALVNAAAADGDR